MNRLLLSTFIVVALTGCRTKTSRGGEGNGAKETSPAHTIDAPKKTGSIGAPSTPPQVAGADKWSYPKLPWTVTTEGLSRMKKYRRPGLVVVKGEWCPHCRRYAKLFEDPEIQKLAESFELILVDSDSAEAASFSDTGTYVPRTLFLSPDGEKDLGLKGPNAKYPHFFSVSDRDRLVRALKEARGKYGS